jgi:hypothetical protein
MPGTLKFVRLELLKENMGAGVRYNATLTGALTGRPAVSALVLSHNTGAADASGVAARGWCLLADHPDNDGVSVTNGAMAYAAAVCQTLECDISDLAWFELDSMGAFDELHLLGETASFAPLIEPGLPPRTAEAFIARAQRVFSDLPAAFIVAVHACTWRPAAGA